MSNKQASHQQIGFIGGGNMGAALIGGLIANGRRGEDIFVSDHHAEKERSLEKRYQAQIADNPLTLLQDSDVIVIAIKPHHMKALLSSFANEADIEQKLFISVAAGITTLQMQSWLGKKCPVIRAMPNTPSLIGFGITGLFSDCASNQKQIATTIFGSVGEVVWVDNEELMDTITAVSGSGPAYFFYFIELMIEAAVKLGLSTEQAQKLCLHTALGAANMATMSDDSISDLRKKVTSKGGTTEAGLNSLQSADFKTIVHQALIAAQEKGKILSKQND